MLDKNKIFSRKPIIKKVRIESLEDDIYIKEFIVSERNKLRESETVDYQLISIILGVCDKDGTPLFDDSDIDQIASMPQIVADELFMAVYDGNEAKNQVETAKN